MEKLLDISIVIVSWNVEDLLKKCIEEIYSQVRFQSKEVIVVDNASSDGTIAMICREFPNVILIPNTSNVGFAKACNQGIRVSQGRYILLLNPDSIVQGGIEKLISFVQSKPYAGVVGCQLTGLDGTKTSSYSSFPTALRVFTYFSGLNTLIKHQPFQKMIYPILKRFPSQSRHLELSDKIEEVDYIVGAFFLFRRELYELIGPFDENYFLYFEETDFCLKARTAGYTNYFFPHYSVVHLGGQSTNKTGYRHLIYFSDSLRYYFKKNSSYYRYAWVCIVLHLAIYIRLVSLSILSFSNPNKKQEMGGYWRLLIGRKAKE